MITVTVYTAGPGCAPCAMTKRHLAKRGVTYREVRLRAGGDGECCCSPPPFTEGPYEFCPWHGRPYSELVEILVRQQAEYAELQAEAEMLREEIGRTGGFQQ